MLDITANRLKQIYGGLHPTRNKVRPLINNSSIIPTPIITD